MLEIKELLGINAALSHGGEGIKKMDNKINTLA